MRHLHDLRCRLQQRRNRVYKTDYRQFETELQIFLKFLDDNPYLRALLHTLDATDDTDFEHWKANLKRGSASFPPSETARAKLCLCILKECAYDPHEKASLAWTSPFSSERNINDRINDLNEAVLDPFVNYLDDGDATPEWYADRSPPGHGSASGAGPTPCGSGTHSADTSTTPEPTPPPPPADQPCQPTPPTPEHPTNATAQTQDQTSRPLPGIRRTGTSPTPAGPQPLSKDFTPLNPRFRAGPNSSPTPTPP